MSEIQAFRGIRYNLGHVGSLSDVVSPPYDVIGPELLDELYKKHPCNFVRIDLNRIEPGDDDEANNRYTRAAEIPQELARRRRAVDRSRSGRSMSITRSSTAPARPTPAADSWPGIQLSKFGEGQVFPHEETLPAAKVDRLMLMHVTKANLSPIFGLYPDKEKAAEKLLDKAVAGKTPLVATDHLGVTHRLWPVTDANFIERLDRPARARSRCSLPTATTATKPPATTGTRSTTAASSRPTHPANYTLMMFVAMEDPGLIVMPTHRLFSGVPELTAAELAAKLGDCFTCRVAAEGPDAAPELWEDIETLGAQGVIGLYTKKDNKWTLATLTDAGRPAWPKSPRNITRNGVPWASPLAPPHYRRPVGLQEPAQAELRASGRRSRHRIEDRRISAGRLGHARHGRRCPPHQPPRRTHAGEEHVFLSEAFERTGDQSAGITISEPQKASRRVYPALSAGEPS